jgi:hypothetical protein
LGVLGGWDGVFLLLATAWWADGSVDGGEV